MKSKLFKLPGSRPRLIAILAIASIPATVYAFTGHIFSVYMNGQIGNNSISSSHSGVLLVGNYNTASSGNGQSLAVGSSLIIYDSGSALIGRWNHDTGEDELLILGNGTGNSQDPLNERKRNALEVLKNGRTKLVNSAWKKNTGYPLAVPPGTGNSGGDALVVEGHTRLLGKVVIEEPQGDIPMFGQ